MSWLVLALALELGMVPEGGVALYQSNWETERALIDSGLYVELGVEAQAFGFFLGGAVRTEMIWTDRVTGFPHSALYSFTAGYRYKAFEAGFRHVCYHPVVPYMYLTEPRMSREGYYEELYVRASVKGSPFK